ncbi:aldose 1-epimerase family protein [Butyrivibrio sp. XPD2006]|uniref:aldose 1-epimerase family protein n=1 Tax=Butyrivibrio sp. XPD2006 TaxID=1280668 RepID=UPI0003B6A7CA|nr:aldose 1-epimerase family protein [Butyrivibrio sp. XPD2006]
MKKYSISNGTYNLTVSDHGAEITSLLKNGRQLMWQADPAFWGRTSPVLFPLVGNYWQKKSRFAGRTYEMGQHGFARDMDFSLLSQTGDELVFELRDNEATHEKYPFSFVLRLGYKLGTDGVEVIWEVENPTDGDIFFSIGGHPAFNCDLSGDKLLFMKKGKRVLGNIESKIISLDGSGCLSDNSKELSLNDGELALKPELFDEDALIIEDEQADMVAVINSAGEELVSVSFDAPLFGVWSPAGKNAPFVCIEPWYGRCDRVGFTGDLSEREYGNRLGAGEKFRVSYTIA